MKDMKILKFFMILFLLFMSFLVNIFLTNNTGPLINDTYA